MADEKPKKQIAYSSGTPNNRKASTVVTRVDIEEQATPEETTNIIDDIRSKTINLNDKLRKIGEQDFTDLGVNVFDYLKELRDSMGVASEGPAGVKWMRDTIRHLHEVADLSVEEKFIRDEDRIRSRTSFKRIGWMYMFNYQPLNKATEKYYDTFPLVFILKLEQDGFTGINLHYLPPQLRERLFLMLLTLSSGSLSDDNTRLVLRYNYLMTQTRFRFLIRPCIRKYLYRRMDSYILKIPPDDWYIATFLPLSRFKKAHRALIWKDTRSHIVRDRLQYSKKQQDLDYGSAKDR